MTAFLFFCSTDPQSSPEWRRWLVRLPRPSCREHQPFPKHWPVAALSDYSPRTDRLHTKGYETIWGYSLYIFTHVASAVAHHDLLSFIISNRKNSSSLLRCSVLLILQFKYLLSLGCFWLFTYLSSKLFPIISFLTHFYI